MTNDEGEDKWCCKRSKMLYFHICNISAYSNGIITTPIIWRYGTTILTIPFKEAGILPGQKYECMVCLQHPLRPGLVATNEGRLI